MMDMINFQSAPKPDLDPFSGNPLEYLYFKAIFHEVFEKVVRDQKERLTRLIQKTEGDAKEFIKHLVHFDRTDCYYKAVELLDKEYDNPHLLSCTYLKELREWKPVKEHDAAGFKRLYRFLLKCQTYKTASRLQELDSTDMIRTVISKLHSSIQGRWVSKAIDIRNHHSKDANFDDLVHFMNREGEVLTDPAYSRDALADTSTFKTNTALLESNVTFLICSLCQGAHDIEDCEEFLKLNIDQRHKTVFKEGLCFSCPDSVGGDHVAKTCT